ncbi:unnamed protein product, partial [Closterium sp. NIES-53]
ELRWLTYLLTDLGEPPRSPPVLYQRGQLHLAYVATRANTADVFTKALLPCDHQRSRADSAAAAPGHREQLPTEQLHSDRHYCRRHHPYERTTHVAAGVKGGRADAAAAAAGQRQKLPTEQLHSDYYYGRHHPHCFQHFQHHSHRYYEEES